jgi:DNA processing protein
MRLDIPQRKPVVIVTVHEMCDTIEGVKMKISENALNVLTACEYRGIGKAWVNKNLRGGESVQEIVNLILDVDSSASVADFEERKCCIERDILLLGDAVDGVTGIGDEDFPVVGHGVKNGDRPIALFYRGDIGLIKTPADNVAVIGLLTPTEKIENAERNVVRRLVEGGKCIVSGLAHGCDSIAHRETLLCGGKTVAILSSPLNDVNPPSNRPLASEIVNKGGLLVSEYFRGVRSKREFIGRYAERDRLQAMFSESVVLAASYSQRDYGMDSGSRFAMGKAVEYGVSRFVIYDSVRDANDPMFNLSREAIAAGAVVLDSEGIDCGKLSAHHGRMDQQEFSF